MIRYSLGIRKKAIIQRERLRSLSKRTWAVLTRYPVYRPVVDHSLYEIDNRKLGTTTKDRAVMAHRVSCPNPIPEPALIEFEHGLALIGHVDQDTDFSQFRKLIPEKIRAFFEWFNPDIHRLVCPTHTALDSFKALYHRREHNLPESSWEVLPWAREKRRPLLALPTGNLHAFHAGGFFPFSKGTRDVFAVAKLCPSVIFHVSADLNHPFIKKNAPQNVNLYPFESKTLYDNAMKKSHVLIHPIYGDGWGVGLEAMSLAMPIIVYDSYDKSEMVSNNETGHLIRIPKHLSFYDSFLNGSYRNWDEYNAYVASGDNAVQVESLASALENYCRSDRLLMEHSRATAVRFDKFHNPKNRIRRIKEIYTEILSSVRKGRF